MSLPRQPAMTAGEFGLIARHFAPLCEGDPDAFGLTDDAARLRPAAGYELVVTADCMVSGVHFLDSDGPHAIASKLLRVNLSDLAAMGARPHSYVLTLALPRGTTDEWLARFAAGLRDDQKRYRVRLVGGDTTATPGGLVASITAFGEVPTGRLLRRNGAAAGDALFVSGTIGDAALGLAIKLGRLKAKGGADLLARLHYPEPRVALGQRLLGVASAALDVSDGLVQDAGHIAETSGLAIEIEAGRVPLSSAAASILADHPDRLADILSGGDDYELVFSGPARAEAAIQALATELGVPIARIGRLLPGSGVTVLDYAGRPMPLARGGYQHF